MNSLSATDCRAGRPGPGRIDAPGRRLLASILLITLIAPAWAAPRTVTLAVPGMTCAACPITVKKALSRVEGVSNVEVSYARRDAVVSFDDAKTSVEALTEASANAGYPAVVKP